MHPYINPLNTDKENEKECLSVLTEYGLPKTGWWAKYPQRAIEEIYKMACNTTASLKQKGNALIWEEWIRTNFDSNFLILIKAEDFPFRMPEVYVKDPKINPSHKFHMLQDGKLCLMHPDDHISKNSILSYRNQSAAWCFAYEVFINTGRWPAAEHPH